MKPWQATFVIVGLAGLIPALLFALTIREPKRRELANKDKGRASSAEIRAFMRLNRKTLICHHVGLALTIMTAYGFGNWMPTFFLRVHEWSPARFSMVYGSIMIVAGILMPLMAAYIAGKVRSRGVIDGTWRVALVGSSGVTICGALAPLMPTPESSLAVYVLAGLFSSFPAVLALIAISEFVPNEMRGTITAVYFLLMGFLATGLGPYAVGFATDYLFKDKAAIGHSLSLVSLMTGVPGSILLASGLRSFRESLGRVTWIAPTALSARH
jgi:MFS family permease